MQRSSKNLGFRIKSFDEASGEFEGWASVYDVLDYDNEVMQKGCFTKSLAEIAAGKQRMPLLLWSHEAWKPPIGKWVAFEDSDKGLYARGIVFDEADPLIRRGIKEREINALSVGFTGEGDFNIADGVLTWKECVLMETSLCNFGANPEALLTRVKSGVKITKRDLEKILRESGYTKTQAQTIVAAYVPDLRDSEAEERGRLIGEIMKTIKSMRKLHA